MTGAGGGNGGIAETIFSLKSIAFSSRTDSTTILENEESDNVPKIETDNYSSSKEKKKYCSRMVHTLNVMFLLLLLGCSVALIFVYNANSVNIENQNHRLIVLEKLMHKKDSAKVSSSVDPVKKELKALEHKFISSLEINKVFVENITAEIKNLKENYVSQMKGFLLEANLSLCLENRRKLTVPVAGNYKLFVTLSVKGHIYPGEDIASIKLSNSSISGGNIKISKDEADSPKIACNTSARTRECHEVQHAVIIHINTGDEINISYNQKHSIENNKMCLKYTDVSLPGGVISTVISH